MRGLVVTILLLSAPTFAFAQVGKGSTLWQWSADAEHHKSIVEVSLNGATGTGVVIDVDRSKPVGDGFQGHALTAYHVVEKDGKKREVKVKYHTGKVASRCKVVAFDKENDLAILWVWVPKGIEPAEVATKDVGKNQKLEYTGLGGGSKVDCCLRHFEATAAAPTNSKRIYADVSLLPGDSGGPVFNEKREVVGIISGGWFWFDGGVKTGRGTPFHTTWPARSCNVGVIQSLILEVPELSKRRDMLAKKASVKATTRSSRLKVSTPRK